MTRVHDLELARLRDEIEALRAEVDRLRGAPHEDEPPTPSRRALLTRGVLAAGAGLVGAGALADRAAAAPNDPVLVDNAHTGSGTTKVSSSGPTADALFGEATAASGLAYGVRGVSSSTEGRGVSGESVALSGTPVGVIGSATAPEGTGVQGVAASTDDSASGIGVHGVGLGPIGRGVLAESFGAQGLGVEAYSEFGTALRATSDGFEAVQAFTSAAGQAAVVAQNTDATSTGTGVIGISISQQGVGVVGRNDATAGPAIGVDGRTESDFGIAVRGEYPVADGFGTAVQGLAYAERSIAVDARNTAGLGLSARSDTGTALRAISGSGYGIVAAGARSALTLAPSGPPPQLDTIEHFVGDIYLDDNADLWLCTADGTPGSWQRLNGPTLQPAPSVTPVAPFRVYDSRFDDGALAQGDERVISVADAIDVVSGQIVSADAVPAGATAIFFNLTVTNTAGAGFLSVAPGDATALGASSVNWSAPAVTTANGTLTTLDGSRQVKVFCDGIAGAGADVIVDVTGFIV